MNLKIPRGSTYHKITEEIKDLYFSIFSDLNNQKIINQFEEKFATYNGSKYSWKIGFATEETKIKKRVKKINEGLFCDAANILVTEIKKKRSIFKTVRWCHRDYTKCNTFMGQKS